jgi:hypothetical protein
MDSRNVIAISILIAIIIIRCGGSPGVLLAV